MTDLTKETLRASTYGSDINSIEDLYAFCYQYFMDAIERRENPEADMPEQARMSNEELIDKVGALFEQADQDGNGFLDRKEFKAVFTSLKVRLKC